MSETVTTFLYDHNIPPLLIIFIISLLPILELRGGLIAASFLGIPWYIAAPVCIIANFIPVPFIILFIERILCYMKDHGPRFTRRFATWVEAKGMKKGSAMMEKHPTRIQLGLFVFVGIPLPVTGAWTGSLIAALFGLPPKRSAPAIGLGICMACVIMLVIAYIIPGAFGL